MNRYRLPVAAAALAISAPWQMGEDLPDCKRARAGRRKRRTISRAHQAQTQSDFQPAKGGVVVMVELYKTSRYPYVANATVQFAELYFEDHIGQLTSQIRVETSGGVSQGVQTPAWARGKASLSAPFIERLLEVCGTKRFSGCQGAFVRVAYESDRRNALILAMGHPIDDVWLQMDCYRGENLVEPAWHGDAEYDWGWRDRVVPR